jgi:hypothetical protein
LLLSDNQTLYTALFISIVDREVLSPLTKGDQTTFSSDKVEMTLSERILLSSSKTEQQQTSLYNTASTQVQQVDIEQPLSTQDSKTMLSLSLSREVSTLTNIVAKAVYIIYKMNRCQEVSMEVYSRILSILQPSLSRASAMTAVTEQPGSI